MIDLAKFTGKNDPKEWLNSPFNIGKETVATNGHVLVAVPKLKGYRQLPAKLEKVTTAVAKQLAFIPTENLIPLPATEKTDEYPCRSCRDTGKNFVDHTLCEGYGCSACDHDGEVQTSDPCRDCNGTLISAIAMKVGDTNYRIDEKYLNLFKDFPGLLVAINSECTQLYWKSDDGRGIVMGMKT